MFPTILQKVVPDATEDSYDSLMRDRIRIKEDAQLYKTISFVAQTHHLHQYRSRARNKLPQGGYLTRQFLIDLRDSLPAIPGTAEQVALYQKWRKERLDDGQPIHGRFDMFKTSCCHCAFGCVKKELWYDDMIEERVALNKRMQLGHKFALDLKSYKTL